MKSEENRQYWESRWENEDAPWDHGYPAPPLAAWLSTYQGSKGTALLPGCGSGHDARLLAYHGFEVTAVDVSKAALDQAKTKNRHSRIRYVRDDFLNPTHLNENRFQWIFEHTCLCAIDPGLRSTYAKAVEERLVPGGHFFGIFYLKPASESGPPFGITPDEIDHLFGARFSLMESWQPEQAYENRHGRERCRIYVKKG